MDRLEKERLVASLREMFESMHLVVVTHHVGLSVAEISDLRRQMRDAGANFKVTKNRLTRLALEGTKFSGLSDLFRGPTAIAYSEDPVAAAKVAVNFAKDNDKLTVLGGALEKELLDQNAVKALATLLSLDEQRALFVRLLQTPATRIAGVLREPAGQLARVLGAYGAKEEAA